METADRIVGDSRSKSVVSSKSKSAQRGAPCRGEVFLAGIVGAFAPQVLRWYVQADSSAFLKGPWDSAEIAGRLVVSVAFLLVAGYLATLWEVRSLREAFMIGLGVPSIILGPGADLATLGSPRPAQAQTAYSVGAVEVSATSDGTVISHLQIEASRDGRRYIGEGSRLTLTPGTYRLQIRASGYESEERQVTVTAHNTTRLDISLRPLSATQRFIKGAGDVFRR